MMVDYGKLVKSLHICVNGTTCVGCIKNDDGTDYGCKPLGDIELVREAADAIESTRKAYQMMATAYEAEVTKQMWIPVTERLPKYGDWVLGIGPKKGYHVCEYRGITHFPYSGDSPWFSAKGRSLNITHWMPLPEPPKEET